MIVRALDENNDWTFGKGRNNYYRDQDAIAQNIKTRLQEFLGNCFFNLPAGIDWWNLLGSKNQLGLELAVRTTILNTAFVSAIVKLEVALNPVTRLITMTYTVETAYTKIADLAPIVNNSSFLLTEDGDVLTTEDGNPLSVG
jgi:hypothetical protein